MPFKTEALVLQEKEAPFVLQEIELDDPLNDEVLIEIYACGLCHTDLSIQSGAFPSAFPCTTGHEGSGVVVSTGKDVTKVKKGDPVLLNFASCGNCRPCKKGHPAGCANWIGLNFGRQRSNQSSENATLSSDSKTRIHGHFFGQSSFSKHALVNQNSVVKVPTDSDLIMLAPLGCGLQTGSGAIFNVAKPDPDSSVVVFGAGAVGISAVFAAAALNVQTIILIDLVQERLDLALTLGATHVINSKKDDTLARIKEITEGAGADVVVECTGAPICVEQGWNSLANAGIHVQCGTQGPQAPKHQIDIFASICSCKTFVTMAEGDSNPEEFIPRLVDLFKKGQFPIDKISKTFSYKDFDKATHAMHHGETIKPIIVFKD